MRINITSEMDFLRGIEFGNVILEEVLQNAIERLAKQVISFPPGFPADRNGIRLGIAAIQDEVKELHDAWYDDKRSNKNDDAHCWGNTLDELYDVIAVALYTALDIQRHEDQHR